MELQEIMFLDESFAPVAPPICGAISVVWSLRYQACGTFTAVFPLTAVRDSVSAAVYLTDGVRCGRMETILMEDGKAEIRGQTLECLLYDRLFAEPYVFTGSVGEACLHAVRTVCDDMPFTIAAENPLFAQTGVYRARWQSVGAWLHSTLASVGGSYAVDYSPSLGQCIFRLTHGVEEATAVFSEDFGNIASLRMERDRSMMTDRLYVVGEDGTVVTVLRENAVLPYRDALMDASDVCAEDYEVFADYTDALYARGSAYLAENGREILRVDGTVETAALPQYGTDYALGDICLLCAPSMGLTGSARLTQLDVVCENGVIRQYPYFGTKRQTLRELLS